MAFYIPIRKETDDDRIAIYLYGVEMCVPLPPNDACSEYNYGRIAIDKISGSIDLVGLAVGDESRRHYIRAAQKLLQSWKTGALPDETCYAA